MCAYDQQQLEDAERQRAEADQLLADDPGYFLWLEYLEATYGPEQNPPDNQIQKAIPKGQPF
jgi:hypothetical protein